MILHITVAVYILLQQIISLAAFTTETISGKIIINTAINSINPLDHPITMAENLSSAIEIKRRRYDDNRFLFTCKSEYNNWEALLGVKCGVIHVHSQTVEVLFEMDPDVVPVCVNLDIVGLLL